MAFGPCLNCTDCKIARNEVGMIGDRPYCMDCFQKQFNKLEELNTALAKKVEWLKEHVVSNLSNIVKDLADA